MGKGSFGKEDRRLWLCTSAADAERSSQHVLERIQGHYQADKTGQGSAHLNHFHDMTYLCYLAYANFCLCK